MIQQKKYIIYCFGKPGSGKGTVAHFIQQTYNAYYISASKLLFNFLEKNYTSNEIKNILNGSLKYYPVLNNLIIDNIIQNTDSNNIIIIDGYPRMLKQMQEHLLLINTCKIAYYKIILHLHVADKIAYQRIINRVVCTKCNFTFTKDLQNNNCCKYCKSLAQPRQDDTEQVFKIRLNTYQQTIETMNAMKQMCNHYIHVNTNHPYNLVVTEIQKKLKSILHLP